MLTCADPLPRYEPISSNSCNGTYDLFSPNFSFDDSFSCVNWNAYYTKCEESDFNPFRGSISFDNIGYAWIAIFQVCFNLIIFFFYEICLIFINYVQLIII